VTTPTSVLTATTAPLGVLTASDAAGIAAALGLLLEAGGQILDEASGSIFDEAGG
jgi:hypothetical protein